MATRQYVGARYVPKFATPVEWSASRQYEALEIVTHMNASYTSKKPVPTGVDISNTEYWAITGNYSAQVEQYRQETETYNAQVEQYRQETEDIKNYQIKQEKLKNRKFIFIGDSYNTEIHHGGWGQKIISKLGLISGVNVWNTGLGGAGFGTENSFYTLLTNISATINNNIKEEITDIVIAGGINDNSKSYDEIRNGIHSCEQYVATNYPNAKLWILICGWSYENDNIRANALNAYNYYNEAAKTATVIDKLYTIFLNPYFLESDMVHPTDNGMNNLSNIIIRALYGGNVNNKEYSDLLTSFTLNNSTIRVNGNITPYGYHIWKADSVGIRFSAPVTITHGQGTLIGTHSGIDENNLFMRKATFPCSVLYDINNTYKEGRGIINVIKDTSSQTWNMYLSSESILAGDYPVENVSGVYILFDCWLDVTKN